MVSGGNVSQADDVVIHNTYTFKDKNTPAVVSLAAGGIAGGVEGFLSVRPMSHQHHDARLMQLVVPFGVCEDSSAIESREKHTDT
jgi:hypothetical protein